MRKAAVMSTLFHFGQGFCEGQVRLGHGVTDDFSGAHPARFGAAKGPGLALHEAAPVDVEQDGEVGVMVNHINRLRF